jgi:hypothetical protein
MYAQFKCYDTASQASRFKLKAPDCVRGEIKSLVPALLRQELFVQTKQATTTEVLLPVLFAAYRPDPGLCFGICFQNGKRKRSLFVTVTLLIDYRDKINQLPG